MEFLPSDDSAASSSFGEPACRRVLGCCDRLAKARTRRELGLLIAREMQAYSVFELQVISGKIHHEIDRLPSPYREAVRPYFLQQVFEPHHQALLLHRSAWSPFPDGPLEDPPLFREYLTMVPSGCFSRDLKSEYVPHLTNPAHTLFYYLVGAFTMFVLGLPGHPEGMPFPGGFRVERKDRKFYCPVRDKEKEVQGCLCNYCPALQSPEP
ncbi:MAG: DUF2115 domain-containing protein [Methanoregulaceae archaeon]|jgi:hypothetical protein|nr:DUF2115 domain-containing protein [Methanoregulaceae archaeon]